MRVITAPPYFPSWLVNSGYGYQYYIEQLCGVRVRCCPLLVPKQPSGHIRLLTSALTASL